jgi:hypothetical protein
MNRWSRRDETTEREWAEKSGEQHEQHHLLHCPE